MNLRAGLPALADFLETEAQRYKQTPDQLQIKRTSKTAMAVPTLALRHLGKRLREEFGIAHPSHAAIECVIRIALGRTEPIPAQVVANALRTKT